MVNQWGVLCQIISLYVHTALSPLATDTTLIEKGVHSQSAVAVQFGLAALCLLPSLWFMGDNNLASLTNTSVLMYMAIAPMFLGYMLFGFGLKVIDASRATLITLIEPLVATLLAIFIVGEHFKLIGWFGMGLVSLCLLLQTTSFNFHTNFFFSNIFTSK